MSNSMKKNNKKGVSLQTKIEKFENKISNTKDFISNHKHIDEVEKELLFMSFDTLLEFVDKKTKDLK